MESIVIRSLQESRTQVSSRYRLFQRVMNLEVYEEVYMTTCSIRQALDTMQMPATH